MNNLVILYLSLYNDTLCINQIRVARDQGQGRIRGWIHDLYKGRLNDLGASDHVGICAIITEDYHLISGVKFMEMAEDFTKNVVMSRKDHVAVLAWDSRTEVLRHASL